MISRVHKVLTGYRVTVFTEAMRLLGLVEGDLVIVRLGEDGVLKVIPAKAIPRVT